MATTQMSKVIQHLCSTVLQDGPGLTDGQLLGGFIEHRDEAAFAALVKRHGPMVWGVCRRLLNQQDAEDAFQATFLVLVRKAASIVPREMLANWLYGVAHRAALQSRRTAARRRAREKQVVEMPDPAVSEQDLWQDLRPLLDQELSRLPDKYRAVVVLCDLEGKTRKEAAEQLGLPEGTVAGWLARARGTLAKRLARRGVVLSGGTLAAVLSHNAASACVPPAVMATTIKVASLLALEKAATTGLISVKVAALTEGVVKAMFMSKLKIATAVLLMVTLLGMASVLTLPLLAQNQKEKEAAPQPATAAKKQMSHDAIICCVAFSPDGKTLAWAATDKTIKLWDVATGQEQATLKGHTDWVLSLAYSPDGQTLASGSKDTTIKLWDVVTGQEQATLPGHADSLCPVAFSPDGKTLAGGSKDRTIKLWDVRTAKVRATLKWRKDWVAEQVAPLTKDEVALAYSPDGKTLASGNWDKTIKLWDTETLKERATLKEHVGGLTCLVYSPDGQTLASAGGPINLWDVTTGKLQAVLMAQPHFPQTSLAFSPDGKTLASSGQGKKITLWDVQTGKERATLTEQTDHVSSVAFSPDGKVLASASRHYLAANRWLGTIKLWDMPAALKKEK